MTYGLFFGCIVPNRYPGVENAVRWLCSKNGLDMDCCDMPDASCCPVPGIFYSTDKDTWLAIAARNLSLAQSQKLQVMTVCNGCFSSLLKATEYLADPKNTAKANRVLGKIGKKYTGVMTAQDGKRKLFEPVKVRHIADVLYRDVGIEKIRSRVTTPMSGIKVAVHYGCHYLRPTGNTTIDDPHNPVTIDALVAATGAESLDYENKLDCCGAGGGVRSHVVELANALTKDKCDKIYSSGADCIVTGCPFCLLQFDNAQLTFAKDGVPVIHIAQFLAIALGMDPKGLCFRVHKVPVQPLLRKLKLEG